MVVDERQYSGTTKFNSSGEYAILLNQTYVNVPISSCTYEQAQLHHTLTDPIERHHDHVVLREALILNAWERYGETS